MPSEIVYIAISVLLGIVFVSQITMPFLLITLCILIVAVLYYFFRKEKSKRFFLYGLLFCIGAQLYIIADSHVSVLNQYIGKNATIEVVIKENGVKGDYYYKYLAQLPGKKEQLYLYTKKEAFQVGDLAQVTGKVERIKGKTNPNTFDFGKYYESKRIYVTMQTNQLQVIEKGNGSFKSFVKTKIFEILPQKEAAVLYGILTGDKGELDVELKEQYMEIGIGHILAVSGLHIGFLYALLEFLLKYLTKNLSLRSGIIATLLCIYVAAIGIPLSALRALLMILIFLLGRCLKENYDFTASISTAMLLILLIKPMSIHDTGFWISFACVYSIAFLNEPVAKMLRPLPSWIRRALATSLAIQIGTLPMMIYNFNQINPLTIVINLLAIPLTMCLVILGFTALGLSLIIPMLATAVFATCYYIIRLLTALVQGSVSLVPTLQIPSMTIILMVAYYCIVFYLLINQNSYLAYMATACIVCTIFIAITPFESTKITFLDVGQGDGTLLQTNQGTNVLIDGGLYDITDLILKQGIAKIDILVITHFHKDHVNGAISLLEDSKVKQVIVTSVSNDSPEKEKVLQICKEKNIPLVPVGEGDAIKIDHEIQLEVLSPKRSYTNEDENLSSLFFNIQYGDLDILFCSDVNKEIEKNNLHKLRDYDIIKVGHHGSRYSTSQELVNITKPEIAIMQVGRNTYGHPTKEVLDRLSQSNAQIYRTDLDGAIIIKTKGKNMKIKTMN